MHNGVPVIVGASLLLAVFSCDTDAPDYHVPQTTLRLIPETSVVGAQGGPSFVLIEISRPVSPAPFIVYIEAINADLHPLPGLPSCPNDPVVNDSGAGGASPGATDGAGGAGGALGSTGGSTAPGGSNGASSESGEGGVARTDGRTLQVRMGDIALPHAAFHCRGKGDRQVCETGVVAHVPAGDQEVLLLATAFLQAASAKACNAKQGSQLALATTRILRDDAGSGSGGAGGSGGETGATTGGGGHGGAPTSTTTGGEGGDDGAGGSAGGTAGSDAFGGQGGAA